jgi:hypothetical protein
VIAKNGVAIVDLNAHITPHLATMQNPRDVHYSAAGSEHLAKKVAESITQPLAK